MELNLRGVVGTVLDTISSSGVEDRIILILCGKVAPAKVNNGDVVYKRL